MMPRPGDSDPSSPVGTFDGSAVANRVHAELVHAQYELTPWPVATGLLFAALLGWAVLPTAGATLAVGWIASKWLLGLARLLECRTFAADLQREAHIASWNTRYAVLMALDAATWGAIGVLFVPSGNVYLDGVLLASVAGIAAVGVFTLLGNLLFAAIFLSLVLLPSVLHHLAFGTPAAYLAGFGLLIYWAILLFESSRGNHHYRELTRLRHHNEWIAEQHRAALVRAEESSAAKSRFLATVSHEIRTPLNGILGMAQLLQQAPLRADESQRAAIIANSARHLRTIIDDILDMSRIESGRLAIDWVPFDLVTCAQDVLGTLAELAAGKGLALDLQIEPTLARWWFGDAARVRQVLHNLIGNAIKFTPHGRVVLQLGAGAAGLRMQVSDTGPGIPPQALERIFEPFEQAETGADRSSDGTGLGLAIARQLARAMGGDVQCTRSDSSGSTFCFDLAADPAPAADVAAAPPPCAAAASDETDPPAAEAAQALVLLVEDNPVNALVASEMMAHFGIAMAQVNNGHDALARQGDRRIALVLMDCQMPGMDGFETTRRWRELEAGAHHARRVPIVAVTANASADDRHNCLAAGMDDFLAKPFELTALQAMVARWVPHSDATR